MCNETCIVQIVVNNIYIETHNVHSVVKYIMYNAIK